MAKLTYLKHNADDYVLKTENPQYHDSERYTKISKAEYEKLYREQCKAQLLKHLSKGDTVYSVIRHVAASGMSRRIDFFAIRDNKPIYITGYIEGVLYSYKRDHKRGGLVVGGCGMDMPTHVVYNVASAIFDDTDNDSCYALKSETL